MSEIAVVIFRTIFVVTCSYLWIEELAYMASGTRDEFTDAVENVTSRQAKLAEAQGARKIGKASTAQRE
jgi:hypothetical protein